MLIVVTNALKTLSPPYDRAVQRARKGSLSAFIRSASTTDVANVPPHKTLQHRNAMTTTMSFKFLFATLLCLAHGQILKAPQVSATPSPSPYSTSTPSPSTSPPRGSPSSSPGMKYSMAPTAGVGQFLGRCGQETPAFRKRCKKCCRKTKKKWKKVLKWLKRCDRCKLKANLYAGNSGPCPDGALLGWSGNPSFCFFDRCHKMLIAKGPCMCF